MSSLFRNSDLKQPAKQESVQPGQNASAMHFDSDPSFVIAPELAAIKTAIGELQPGRSVWFKTDGAWSSYDLLGYILGITGPAEVCFTTWSISEVAISKFLSWKNTGVITDLQAVIDVGLRNRKPAIFAQAVQAFPKLKIAHCHAKATVVISGSHHITFIGSANYTKNPRKEVGVIIWDEAIALANQQWIKEEVNGAE
jgi:hypothetical protein